MLTRGLTLALLWCMLASVHGMSLHWDYPADPAGDPPVVFYIYRTTDLTKPFKRIGKVKYVKGKTHYSVAIDGTLSKAFFKVSAANNAGESFAGKD